jgi:hypothetical protein
LILGVSVPLLQPTFELVALAVDGGKIIVRQFRPLLFDLAFDLFPIPFNSVPVHGGYPPGYENAPTPQMRSGS